MAFQKERRALQAKLVVPFVLGRWLLSILEIDPSEFSGQQ